MKRLTPRNRRFLFTAIVVTVTGLAALWASRWHLSRAAVKVADPLVRTWLTNQIMASSDSAYRFTASSIRVEGASRRIAVDTITLVTDTLVNSRLARPHPILSLRFVRCELTGIDLTGLAAGRGLHATHAGCDSVSFLQQTVVAPDAATSTAEDADSNGFLKFQGKLDLPAMLPFVAIDLVAFPHVHVALDLIGTDGKPTALSVDSVAVDLDSVRIDPQEEVAKRRPLFSRNIAIRLDRFAGALKDGAHLSLDHLNADLEDGTAQLDMIEYQPAAGRRADSLGFAAVRARHVALAGVRWRTFLLTGAIFVGQLNVDTATIRIAEAHAPRDFQALPRPPKRLETALRAVGRPVRLDSMAIKTVTLIESGTTPEDTARTSFRQLSVAHFAIGVDSTSWNSPFPIGRVTVAIDGVVRRTNGMYTKVTHLAFDAASQRMVMDSLRSAPEGDDQAFEGRQRFRKARVSIVMGHIEARGVNLPALLRRSALRARALDARRLVIDVLMDKSKPPGPERRLRQTPQAVIRAAATEIQIDTVLGTGMVSYRERDSTAATPGTLTFGALRLRGYNFSTVPARMTEATPFRLIGDAMLMGAGALHVEWEVPLLARNFAMQWRGSLGPMDPKAMNSFLPDAVGMRFTDGAFEGAEWSATVTNGQAAGVLAPRWHDFSVALPGVARNDSGVVGGIMRGVAKLAANTFGIRGDNTALGGHKPIDGSITHQWVNTETLPDFIWRQLREPLLLILMK